MNSGKSDNAENEKKFQEFEAHLKSLVDAAKYKEAMDFYKENSSVSHNIHGDSCTFYSFRIMGVCFLKDTQKTWGANGYVPSKWMDKGDRLFNAGDYPGAIEAYNNATGTDSDKAHYAMGCANRAMGNPYESVEEWGTAAAILAKDREAELLEKNPNDPAVWASIGNIDFNQDKWGSALSSYDNSLSIDQKQPKIWFRKGCCHHERRQYPEALDAFRRVLELQPDHCYAANNAAVTLWNLGQYQRVMEYLDQAAQHCPENSLESHSIEDNKKRSLSPDPKGKSLTFLC
jgi:tetratricopeptide (TPR) repeat protein